MKGVFVQYCNYMLGFVSCHEIRPERYWHCVPSPAAFNSIETLQLRSVPRRLSQHLVNPLRIMPRIPDARLSVVGLVCLIHQRGGSLSVQG